MEQSKTWSLTSVEEALKLVVPHVRPEGSQEVVGLLGACGRVAAEEVRAPAAVPGFTRSTVDGFAVRSADTYGASEALPAFLRVVAEIEMGEDASHISLQPGEAARIATGGMLPQGADAALMVEHTEESGPDEIAVYRPVAPGDNVIRRGEDTEAGALLVRRGRRIRAADVGMLAAVGVTSLAVYAKPTVGIVGTGDEVVSPEVEPGPGQVRDSNSWALAALVRRDGMLPSIYGPVPDQVGELEAALRRALERHAAVLISGGSSVGKKDITAELIDSLGEPGILVHGLAIKPGKPTILAVCDGKPVIGLPGHPASALVVYEVVVRPILERLVGLEAGQVRPAVRATLSRSVASSPGREEYLRVRLVGRTAEPLLGESGLLSTVAGADGLVRIPLGSEGLAAGTEVEVLL